MRIASSIVWKRMTGGHRPEGLLLDEGHLRVHTIEHRGGVECAGADGCRTGAVRPCATASCTLSSNERAAASSMTVPMSGCRIHRVAIPDGASLLEQQLDESLGHRVLNQHAA